MKKLIFFIIIIFILLFVYARYYDTYGIRVKEYSINDKRLPESFDGLKIAHFSDVLYKDSKDFDEIKLVVNKINSLNPDLIVFTGDLVKNNISKKDKESMISILSTLKCNLYKYFVKGDNDTKDSIEILEQAGFIYLNNESKLLFNEGQEPILLAGGDKLAKENYLSKEEINYEFVITMIHESDNFTNVSDNSSIVFAGHSLGGQIRIPFWGALIKKDGANVYTDDYYMNDDSQLFVSYGIGTDISPFRFLNKPSINVYRLYTK